jgi:DNA-binding response OmpR family regulator
LAAFAPSTAGRDTTTRPPDQAGTVSVLVVDDNADAADSLALVLGVHGFTARVAYSGPDALAVATADPPDVVLFDIGMPGMDGWELARRLRAASTVRLLVAVTGYGTEGDRMASNEAGVDLHFVKPVEPDVLVESLRRIERAFSADMEAARDGA